MTATITITATTTIRISMHIDDSCENTERAPLLWNRPGMQPTQRRRRRCGGGLNSEANLICETHFRFLILLDRHCSFKASSAINFNQATVARFKPASCKLI
jgi:hypothetical protein